MRRGCDVGWIESVIHCRIDSVNLVQGRLATAPFSLALQRYIMKKVMKIQSYAAIKAANLSKAEIDGIIVGASCGTSPLLTGAMS